MPKPTAQDCHTLITYFVTRCEAQGVKVRFNRNKARWGFESILLDYTKDEARALIEYYSEHWDSTKLDMDWFLYNYDKVDEDMQDRAEREARQKIIREATKERLERWNDRW